MLLETYGTNPNYQYIASSNIAKDRRAAGTAVRRLQRWSAGQSVATFAVADPGFPAGGGWYELFPFPSVERMAFVRYYLWGRGPPEGQEGRVWATEGGWGRLQIIQFSCSRI